MKADPTEANLKVARGTYRVLSRGGSLPPAAEAKIAAIWDSASADDVRLDRARYSVDLLAAADGYGGFNGLCQAHMALADQLGTPTIFQGQEHMLLDAFEFAYAAHQQGKDFGGAKATVRDNLQRDKANAYTSAKGVGVKMLADIYDGLNGGNADFHNFDDAATVGEFRAKAIDWIIANKDTVASMNLDQGSQINPLIARKQQQTDTAFHFDLLRDSWMRHLPQVDVEQSPPPKGDRGLLGDMQRAVRGLKTGDGLPHVTDEEVGADFDVEFHRLTDLVQVDAEKAAELREALSIASTAIGPTPRQLERHIRRSCRDYVGQRRMQHLAQGRLDTTKLSQIIVDPNLEDIYVDEVPELDTDATVTFLLDCSGSMDWKQGGRRKADYAHAALERIGQSLHRAGVKSEILGFTNKYIRNEGDSSGKIVPQFIVYKDYRESWSQARQNIHLGLDDSFYGGTPEGEAVYLAYKRLLMRPEKQKLLIIVNDGGPNDGPLLRRVVSKMDQDKAVKYAAITLKGEDDNLMNMLFGVEEDEKSYYPRHSATCGSVASLASALGSTIGNLLLNGKPVRPSPAIAANASLDDLTQ